MGAPGQREKGKRGVAWLREKGEKVKREKGEKFSLFPISLPEGHSFPPFSPSPFPHPEGL